MPAVMVRDLCTGLLSRQHLQDRPLDGTAQRQRHAEAPGAPNGSDLSDPRGGQATHRGESTLNEVTAAATPSRGMGSLVGSQPTCLSADRATARRCQRPAFNRPTGGFSRCPRKPATARACRSTTRPFVSASATILPSLRRKYPRHSDCSVPLGLLFHKKVFQKILLSMRPA